MSASALRLAPAKINLFLHVGPLQPDGYHPVASWMTFADIGDLLSLTPAPAWSFETSGEFAPAIGGAPNLAEQAALRLFERAGVAPLPLRMTLDKRLPVAAGLGGGSADAGAALRLLNAALPSPLADEALEAIAADLGADGPACLRARPAMATGRGDRLADAPDSPFLPAVLVNPRRPSSTGEVYRAYDDAPAMADQPELPSAFGSVPAVVEALHALRNDLESPARRLEPAIGEVLSILRSRSETLLARMSGSGATCFALCVDGAAATRLAEAVASLRPDWWIRTCRLSGSRNGDLEQPRG